MNYLMQESVLKYKLTENQDECCIMDKPKFSGVTTLAGTQF
jgi:hypothetical protein